MDKGFGVDPRILVLPHDQGACIHCRTGVANWHDSLPTAIGVEDHISEQTHPAPTDPAFRHQ